MMVSLLPPTTRTWSILELHQLLALLLCAAAGEDFDWTRKQQTAFYYGTFPAGTAQPVEARRLLSSHLPTPLQGSPGEPAAPPTRLKERGTLTGKG